MNISLISYVRSALGYETEKKRSSRVGHDIHEGYIKETVIDIYEALHDAQGLK